MLKYLFPLPDQGSIFFPHNTNKMISVSHREWSEEREISAEIERKTLKKNKRKETHTTANNGLRLQLPRSDRIPKTCLCRMWVTGLPLTRLKIPLGQ